MRHDMHLVWRWLGSTSLFLLCTSCSTTKELVVLLPGTQGQPGAVAIGEGHRSTLLNTPLAAAKIDTAGHVTTGVITQAEVQRTFGQALAIQPPPSITFTLYFLPNSTDLVPESQPVLAAFFAEVEARQAVEVQITGHTDRVGTLADNDRLSMERAQAVRDMLRARGLQEHFIRAVGRGEREPLIPTPDEQHEPRNRRVDILVR